MFCVDFGLPVKELLDISVAGFCIVYKSVKRIEAHKILALSSCLRTSANADKEDYLDYLDIQSLWLHKVERENILNVSSNAGTTEDFIRDFKGGFNVT